MEAVFDGGENAVFEDVANSRNPLFEKAGVGGVFHMPVCLQSDEIITLGYAHSATTDTDGLSAIVIPREHIDAFPLAENHVDHEEWGDDSYFFYNPGGRTVSTVKSRFVSNRRRGCERPALASKTEAKQYTPEIITTANAAKIVGQTAPEKCLYYTGAGISTGDESSVWTFEEYRHQLGISEQSTTEAMAGNRRFTESFLTDNASADHAIKTLHTFINQLEHARPTAAHWAFASIVRALDYKPLIATTNIDWLHQKSGIAAPFLTLNSQGKPQAFLEQDKYFDDMLAQRAASIELAVVIGRSSDSRGLIRSIREHNPAMRTLIFDVHAGPFPYAQQGDALVVGDCQHTLPQLLGQLAL